MKQKERFDEKPNQEHTEPKHHRKAVIKGITVYESFRSENCGIVCYRAWESTEQEQFLKF